SDAKSSNPTTAGSNHQAATPRRPNIEVTASAAITPAATAQSSPTMKAYQNRTHPSAADPISPGRERSNLLVPQPRGQTQRHERGARQDGQNRPVPPGPVHAC